MHALRGRDEEGALRLHEALGVAQDVGDLHTAAVACRELGFIDTQAGRTASAGRWLARATELSDGDDELCAVLGVRGMALSDRAHYGAALDLLHRSVARADRCGRRRQAAWSLSLIGRIHILRDELALAVPVLDDSLALARRALERVPPMARGAACGGRAPAGAACRGGRGARPELPARVSPGGPLLGGDERAAGGLVALASGEVDAAAAHFADAAVRVTRVSDAYAWVHGHSVLDSAAALAVRVGVHDADALVDALVALAERCGLRELVVRAHVHRAALGDDASMAAAQLLAADIDNAALARLIPPVAA